jgi:archaellum biogenesis ATPase FlaH
MVEITKNQPGIPRLMIVMGDPGAGKTTLAAKAPKALFISTDGNATKIGLDSINVSTAEDIAESITIATNDKAYESIIIDTIEGFADILTPLALQRYNTANNAHYESAAEVPFYGANRYLNDMLNKIFDMLHELSKTKTVIVLTYTKRVFDEPTQAYRIDSELKNLRQLTKYADARFWTQYDGAKYQSRLEMKRDFPSDAIIPKALATWLELAGWSLPKKSTKLKSK